MPPSQMNPDDQVRIGLLAGQAFSPSAPITQKDVFAGRMPQIRKVIDAINQAGQSVLIYGERGVGKTSLANVIDEFYLSVAQARIFAPHITCHGEDTYSTIWEKIADERNRPGPTANLSDLCIGEIDNTLDDASGELTPTHIERIADAIAKTHLFIPIVDEFDRIDDPHSIRLITDTIKMLSDRSRNTTVILVGVGDTVTDLVSEHESIERALVQVQMQRMNPNESSEILDNGSQATGVGFSSDAKALVVAASQGFPHYTHALGLYSTRQAVDSAEWTVNVNNVESAIAQSIDNTQQSLKRLYHTATDSPRSEAIFRQVLLACAMTKPDPLGFFSPADIRPTLARILNKGNVEYGTFSQHLADFSSDERGPILQRTGKPRRYRYRFRNPLVQPYVLMSGLRDSLIDKADIHGLFASP